VNHTQLRTAFDASRLTVLRCSLHLTSVTSASQAQIFGRIYAQAPAVDNSAA